MSIQLFVDSTSYLPQSLLDLYKIKVISLSVHFGALEIVEQGADYRVFYDELSRASQLPTSSQPNVQMVTDAFEASLAMGHDVVMVTLSSEMSGTYQTAHMVAKQLLEDYPDRKIMIIDSRTNCMQLGFQAITAAEAILKGDDFETIQLKCKATEKASRFVFAPETLKYLEMGGRIGKASALIGSLLSIKPILTVNDGKTDALAKVRTKRKALETMVDQFVGDTKAYGFKRLCIHHIDNLAEVEKLKAMLPPETLEDVEVVAIGPVIGTHVGPGAIGLVYETQNPMT